MPYADKEKQAEYWKNYYQRHKDKITAYKREWMEKNPDKVAVYTQRLKRRIKDDPDKYRTYFRNHRIKKVYGITAEEFAQILKDQDGVCAICGRLPNGTNHVEQNLVIDHDHNTGVVRGLLCNNCNSGMGIIGDTEEHLLAALAYLRRHAAKEV